MSRFLSLERKKKFLKFYLVSVSIRFTCLDVLKKCANTKINRLHERALRIVKNNYELSFEGFLEKANHFVYITKKHIDF